MVENRKSTQREFAACRTRVAAALPHAMSEACGCSLNLASSDRIDTAIRQIPGWEEVDFADVLDLTAARFGVRLSDEEARAFCGDELAPDEWERFAGKHFTLDALATLIARKLACVRIRPDAAFGKACVPAGCFVAIREIADELFEGHCRFGPSDTISRFFRGRDLELLWPRLRWLSCDQIPELRATWLTSLSGVLFGMGVLSGMTFGVLFLIFAAVSAFSSPISGPEWSAYVIIGWMLCLAIVAVALPGAWLAHRFDDRVPDGIRTFRDLAMLMAQGRASVPTSCADESNLGTPF